MITCYFGVPGCGKTTFLTKFAQKELKRIEQGSSPYLAVYTNFYCEGCKVIDFKDLSQYKILDSLILLDEITLDADNRDFKSFPQEIRDFFVLHRHLGCDIIYATQAFDTVDKKIRVLTQQLWYMEKSVLPLLSEFTTARRIYRTITINEHTSELIMGYRFCNFLEAFFTSNRKLCFRRFYYSKFNSFDEGQLSARPILKSSSWQPNPPTPLPKPDVINF